MLHVLNSRVGLDVGIYLVRQPFFIQKIGDFSRYAEFNQIRIRSDKCFLKAVSFYLRNDLGNGTCAMIRSRV